MMQKWRHLWRWVENTWFQFMQPFALICNTNQSSTCKDMQLIFRASQVIKLMPTAYIRLSWAQIAKKTMLSMQTHQEANAIRGKNTDFWIFMLMTFTCIVELIEGNETVTTVENTQSAVFFVPRVESGFQVRCVDVAHLYAITATTDITSEVILPHCE